jgi:sodium transport system permease protein
MMQTPLRTMLTVLRKEVLENIRDRRTILSAFLFVPLIGPMMFALMTAFIVDRVVGEADERLRLPVIGAEYAPNVLAFAIENGADVVELDISLDAARKLVAAGDEHVVLVITAEIGDRLRQGEPAALELIVDSSNNKAQRHAGRARNILHAYSDKVGRLRLLARGIDPGVMEPFDVRQLDVATPSGRAVALLGTLTYFLLFSLLMGGLYLAIDVTAGERERGTLESLLCLPVQRYALVLGKIGATMAFMLASLFITLTVLVVSMQFLPLHKLGMSTHFGPMIALKIAAIMLPMALLGASLFFVVGSFTRSYREAQTWIGVVLAIPTMPILFASIANVRPSTTLMAVPSLSQHLLATNLLRGDAVDSMHIVVSVISTTLLGALLLWLATRLYRREKLLG